MRRAALLPLLALLGCTITTEWRGDETIVRQTLAAGERGIGAALEWRAGETTLQEVVAELGPPDEFERVGEDLWAVYRHEYRRYRRLQITGYGGARVFTYDDGREVDSVIVIVFDRLDRLAHHGTGKFSADSGLYQVLLE